METQMKTQVMDYPVIQAADAVGDVVPVNARNSFGMSMSLYENLGHCNLGWSETYPGMVRLAVALYTGAPPSNPQAWLWAQEVTNRSSGNLDTLQTWGSGYSAALLGVNAANNAWVYIGVNTPVTVTS